MCARKRIPVLPSVKIFTIVCLCLIQGVFVHKAEALPWDIDMYRQQSLQPNEVVRAPVKGTVPLGHKPFTMTADEADTELKSAVPFGRDSVWRGQRLWAVNCAVCHGKSGNAKSVVGSQLPVPNLLEDFYRQRSDGRIFAVIHNGGAVMPRYGFKLSTKEHWDLVNYLRFLQGRDIAGMERPE